MNNKKELLAELLAGRISAEEAKQGLERLRLEEMSEEELDREIKRLKFIRLCCVQGSTWEEAEAGVRKLWEEEPETALREALGFYQADTLEGHLAGERKFWEEAQQVKRPRLKE